MAIEKILLSGGGTDGGMLTSDGNNQTIHTASSVATEFDEVWIWGTNMDAQGSADVEVTVGWGRAGWTASNSLLTVPHTAGWYLIVPGLLLQGSTGTPKIVNVYAASGDINFAGYVNRHSA